jgi:hypothetical protein
MRALNKIPQDCTQDQNKFKEKLKNKDVYHSIDLSNATDRFPIDLIFNILAARLPLDYVQAWKRVMVGHKFDFKNPIDKKIEKLAYSVGNPMGAYSSFNSFALTHHYVIYYCCRVLGKN